MTNLAFLIGCDCFEPCAVVFLSFVKNEKSKMVHDWPVIMPSSLCDMALSPHKIELNHALRVSNSLGGPQGYKGCGPQYPAVPSPPILGSLFTNNK